MARLLTHFLNIIAFAEVEIGGRKYRGLVDTGLNGDVVASRKVAE